ncbi:hypothetical protein Htur_4644 (plasmid) [Haloterrigena turkmenica DSM 5511]|uniref:Uncharacterized protein n=1 Tax=Haloterrigena turkmenica (strain ATCC 51198 / DSM 5511 / JCM 9101 / NCIMB 13204 / VKM B-1734 / 4k) TaxID=543526 RepID=D2S233_HALTV|nr:hypothetical protein Htur_4644 [Haloterrigena turkmenica DSM 5511]
MHRILRALEKRAVNDQSSLNLFVNGMTIPLSSIGRDDSDDEFQNESNADPEPDPEDDNSEVASENTNNNTESLDRLL